MNIRADRVKIDDLLKGVIQLFLLDAYIESFML